MVMRRLNNVINFGILDQGIVSLGSLLILICASQGLEENSLGVFAISLATVAFVQSVLRSLTGDVLLVGQHLPSTNQLTSSFSASLFGASIAVLATFILGLLIPNLSTAFIGAAIALPGIITQDYFRFQFIFSRQSRNLLFLDVATVGLQASAILFTSLFVGSALAVAFAWGFAAGIPSIVAFALVRPQVSFFHAKSWVQHTWKSGLAYATESLVGATAGYTIIIALAMFRSPSESATFRIAMTVFGFSSVLINFGRSTLVREIRQIRWGSSRDMWTRFGQMTFLLSGSVLVIWLAAKLIPTSIGLALFGENWIAVVAVMTAAMFNRLMAGWSVVPSVFLRSFGITWPVTRVRLIVGVFTFILGPVGAYFGGATGAFLAEAAAYFAIWISLTAMFFAITRR